MSNILVGTKVRIVNDDYYTLNDPEHKSRNGYEGWVSTIHEGDRTLYEVSHGTTATTSDLVYFVEELEVIE